MGNDWKTYRLGKLFETASGLSKSRKEFGFGSPFVSFKDVFWNTFLPNELESLANTSEMEQEKCSVKKGDVFLTRTSETPNELGMSSVALKDYPKATFNGFTKRLRLKKGINVDIDPVYLGYYLRSNKFRQSVFAHSTMTTRASLNNSSISILEIDLPPIDEQIRIGKQLKALDDKIALNRQMNQTLEQMAQALFKSWFVDFDPVIDNALVVGNEIPEPLQKRAKLRQALDEKRKPLPPKIQQLFPASFEFSYELDNWVPEGWKAVELKDIAEVKYGKDHKKLGDGKIPVYGSGGIMRYANDSLYSGESVLIPRKGTLSNIMYVNETFWSVDTMFFTIMQIKNYAKFLYYKLKQLDFDNMNVGSAVPSMTTKVLNALQLLLPEKSVLEAFEKKLSAFYDKIDANKKEIQSLTRLRDTLLPKLVSGEVKVPIVMFENLI